ncbi:MAG: DUF4240 domain-containing protein [Protaetiibacter sp.]
MRTRRMLAATSLLLASIALTACAADLSPLDGWETAIPVDEWPDEPGPPIGQCPWEATGRPSTAPPGGDDPVTVTEAAALPPELFWPLVESVPSEPSRSDFDEVSSALAGCPFSDVVAFEARLTLALYELDGPENLAWFEANDPGGLGFASDDVFLYARCATVLGGEENWRQAVADRTLAWGTDAPDLEGAAESLLYVAYYAARAQGVPGEEYYDAVDAAGLISYETGSNEDRWR